MPDGSPETIAARAGGQATTYTADAAAKKLREFLSAETWAARTIPPADLLLGDLVTTTTRLFLVGQTGLGKTMFGFGLAFGIASGTGFLHWRSARPARVLYIDGEMPGELIKARVIDASRRIDKPLDGRLTIFAQDMEEEFAAAFPTLGKLVPLNLPQGQDFIMELIDQLGGIDVIVLDNVMSLLTGDQKEEVPWSEVLPLVTKLTRAKIGQVWLDHTGHNTSRQYGTSTKAWRFDSVGILGSLPPDQLGGADLGFTLSFEHPGKARRRTPANRHDFATSTILLQGDIWSSESAEEKKTKPDVKLPPGAMSFYNALMDALAVTSTPGITTRTAWYAEAARVGLVDPIEPGDDHKQRSSKQSKFRSYITRIREAGLIGVNGEQINDLRQP